MTDADRLVRSIAAGLGRSDPPLSDTTAESERFDLYEIYLLTLLVRAARSLSSEGVDVRFRTAEGKEPDELIFRRAPGHIYNNHCAFTHAEISNRYGAVLEAHVGIYVKGRSHVLHECDLAVLASERANKARRAREALSYRSLELGGEAKFVAVTSLPLGLGRGFLGLCDELAYPGALSLVATRRNPGISALLRKHQRAHSRFFGDVGSDPTTGTAQAYVEHVRDRLRVWAS